MRATSWWWSGRAPRSTATPWPWPCRQASGSLHVEYLGGEAVEVLFVRLDHDLGHALAFSLGVEHLAPADQCLGASRVKRDGQLKVMLRHVLEDDSLRLDD